MGTTVPMGPLVDKYVTKAEGILGFADKFDEIEEFVLDITSWLGVARTESKEIQMTPAPWCREGNTEQFQKGLVEEEVTALCVSRDIITPENSLYKRLNFPMEMMFLNMLSTVDLYAEEVFESPQLPLKLVRRALSISK